MVDGVNIHFEGDKGLRPGFQKLLAKYISLCRQRGIKFRLVPGGSRYDKVVDGAALLGLIDHAAVSRHCPQFRRLMDFLDRQF